MANQLSVMNRIEILNVVTNPSSVPMGNKTRKAPHGYVEYSMGSKVFYYCMDPAQDKGLIDNLVIGERYDVTSEEWMKGLRKAYKWVVTRHIGTGAIYSTAQRATTRTTVASPAAITPQMVTTVPGITKREAVIELCGSIANAKGNSDEVKGLVTLLMTALMDDENLMSEVL